ncbi:dual specificity protein phosphatase family protein [Myxococcota bacterium]|nr:dual specificity protein phosphatase family protein [Myxococcota bacterium]MBU1533713.1 dual specificity protein phosphatase family protein [Myxococcota bacterium]
MTKYFSLLSIVLFFNCSPVSSSSDESSRRGSSDRPGSWARELNRPGLPNLHRVSPVLYRSAQPTAEGMREAKRMGIKTVVNLRALHSDTDKLTGTGLFHEHIQVKAWHPEVEDVVRFLKIVNDPSKTPVLVHCQHGADRTGVMVAVYRVAVQGWSKKEAIREMKKGGYGYHRIWRNLPRFLKKLHMETIRRRAGIGVPSAAW